jgi:hypothetical protein
VTAKAVPRRFRLLQQPTSLLWCGFGFGGRGIYRARWLRGDCSCAAGLGIFAARGAAAQAAGAAASAGGADPAEARGRGGADAAEAEPARQAAGWQPRQQSSSTAATGAARRGRGRRVVPTRQTAGRVQPGSLAARQRAARKPSVAGHRQPAEEEDGGGGGC